jgi:hypothetical protein
MNLVTVIVPLYNPDLELLRASLDAILADSAVERIERIILVDDGSHIPITRDRLAIESDKIRDPEVPETRVHTMLQRAY